MEIKRDTKGRFVKGNKFWLGKSRKGQGIGKWMKEKNLSKEHKKNISKGLKNSDKRKEFDKRKNFKGKKNPFYGKKHSKESLMKMSRSQKGKKKLKLRKRNKITPLNRLIVSGLRYREWRDFVFKRDDWTCQVCEKKGYQLQAHHIFPFSLLLEKNKITSLEQSEKCYELWDINNGITLCISCHKKTDSYGYKCLKLKEDYKKNV